MRTHTLRTDHAREGILAARYVEPRGALSSKRAGPVSGPVPRISPFASISSDHYRRWPMDGPLPRGGAPLREPAPPARPPAPRGTGSSAREERPAGDGLVAGRPSLPSASGGARPPQAAHPACAVLGKQVKVSAEKAGVCLT